MVAKYQDQKKLVAAKVIDQLLLVGIIWFKKINTNCLHWVIQQINTYGFEFLQHAIWNYLLNSNKYICFSAQ